MVSEATAVTSLLTSNNCQYWTLSILDIIHIKENPESLTDLMPDMLCLLCISNRFRSVLHVRTHHRFTFPLCPFTSVQNRTLYYFIDCLLKSP